MIKLILIFVILCSYPFQQLLPAGEMFAASTKAYGNESANAVKCITGFLTWYNLHLHKVNAFPLLAKDSNGYYLINKKACSNYLAFLQSSNLLSADYIASWQTFFDGKAVLLKEQKIKDDIPEDFDMDFILMTQEPEIVLNNISKLKFNVISINGKTALVGVKLPSDSSVQYKFELIKGKAGWQIAYVSTMNFD